VTDHSTKTVLVTGASRGIGLAVARRFAQSGARVGLVASDPERLAGARAAIGGHTEAVAADLADAAECRRAVSEVERALGPVEVLVSCAGMLRRDFAEQVSVEDFERSFRLHAGAALWLSQSVLAGMRERRRGSLVFVSSELGLIGAPSYASYCTSKAALVSLAEVLRHELVGSGVRVCVVCPSDVRTDQLVAEQAWGPTGGAGYESALEPDTVAQAIVRAAAGSRALVVVDRPLQRLGFTLMAGPRRSRFWPIHQAFRPLLRERRRARE
jgi:NAD(P)-dependent dehydrogenase (short-subunit alcohol dehydrogenase family)